MRVFCIHVCTCTACMSGAHGDQKRAQDPLELWVQMIVNSNGGAGEPNLEPLQKQPILFLFVCLLV